MTDTADGWGDPFQADGPARQNSPGARGRARPAEEGSQAYTGTVQSGWRNLWAGRRQLTLAGKGGGQSHDWTACLSHSLAGGEALGAKTYYGRYWALPKDPRVPLTTPW